MLLDHGRDCRVRRRLDFGPRLDRSRLIPQRDCELVRARQLAKVAERELLEKSGRGAVKKRASHPFAASNDLDQLTLVQRLEHLAAPNAADVLDLGTSDWLAIGNDGQSFEGRRRKPLRSRGELRALDRLGELGSRQYLPATCNFDELDSVAVVVVVTLQLLERGNDVVGRCLAIGGHRLQVGDGNWVGAREERRFKQLR